MKKINLNELMSKIEYTFKDKKILLEAVTHRSYSNEHHNSKIRDNERLEFLGDSVMDLITTEYLINLYPNLSEGELSKKKSQIISETVFSNIALELELGNYLFLSNGEHVTGGKTRKSILGDAFEALIGAIFKDSDYYQTKKVALKFLKDKVENLDKIEGLSDYKTDLQELIQITHKTVPNYEVVSSTGPDHNKKFEVAVKLGEKILGIGVAKSKKEAEKLAAKEAIEKLNKEVSL